MKRVVKSYSLTPEVSEGLKEFMGDNPMGLSQSFVVNMLLSEALDARRRATPVVVESTKASEVSVDAPAKPKGFIPPYQRPVFNPHPKPGGKS